MLIVRIIFHDIDGEVIAIKELAHPIEEIEIPEDSKWDETERRRAPDGIALFLECNVEACRSSLEIMAETFLAIEAHQPNK